MHVHVHGVEEDRGGVIHEEGGGGGGEGSVQQVHGIPKKVIRCLPGLFSFCVWDCMRC